MVKWLSCLPSKQAARVRFPFGVMTFCTFVSPGGRCLCHFAHLLSVDETPMKQPLPKRRRISSNPLTLFSSSGTLAASPKPSKISTCTSCHRAIGLKSSPAFLCTRSAAYCHSKAFLSPYSGNTTDVAHHHVLFAYGHAQVIPHLAPACLALSICHPIRSPFRCLKATRTSHVSVEDGPVMKTAITC